MLSVGLTGGIGSGKSHIAEFFQMLGIPVYNSDLNAKKIMENNSQVRNSIIMLLGEDSYTGNKLNTDIISKRVFSDSGLNKSLNDIVHKHVLLDYIEWKEQKSASKYVIQEAAILFETGHYKMHDFMITVSCPVELREKRLLEMGRNKKDIQNRMDKQWSDQKRNELADFIIINDEKESVIQQVLRIHHKFLAK
jgi:dephospho-CoA kinase